MTKEEMIESCEDCISRQAVNDLVDELARAISDERCYISRGRSTATIMQDILDLPPVTPTICIAKISIDEQQMKKIADEAISKLEFPDCISRQEAVAVANDFDATMVVRGLEKLPPIQPKSEDAKFLEFLVNTINPNEMEQYLSMYHSKEEKDE